MPQPRATDTRILPILWGILAILLLMIGVTMLPACGISVWSEDPWFSFCPAVEDPAPDRSDELEDHIAREADLRERLDNLRTRLILADSCPPPVLPEPPVPEVAEAAPEPPPNPEPETEPPVNMANLPRPENRPEPPPEPDHGIDCPPGQVVRIPREVVFVLDGSRSMLLPQDLDPATDQRLQEFLDAPWPFNTENEYNRIVQAPGIDRIDVARQSLIEAINAAPPIGNIGLVGFLNCETVEDYGSFPPARRGQLIQTIRNFEPDSGTPLARAIEIAANRISGGHSPDDPATIVVVTDGYDSCDGNPCAVAARLARQRPGLRINVLDLAGWTGVECIAELTGGELYRPGQQVDISDFLSEAAGYTGPQACRPSE